MKPDLFRQDLERKPDALRLLADRVALQNPWTASPLRADSRIVLLGMGSSHFANSVGAARLRSRGIDATAVLASTDLLPSPDDRTVVVGVSASGGSAETLAALGHYDGSAATVAVTNVPDSAITALAGTTVAMSAEKEEGGVACRSFLHTLGLWLALESHLVTQADVPGLLRRAAAASDHLLETEDSWRPALDEALLGPDGSRLVAPARRLSSAQQGALMLREGPRLSAEPSETGEWSHVDVYLTKTTDYRLLLFAGSRWEAELVRWVRERGSTLVVVGPDGPTTDLTIRYRGDEEDDVRLLAEVGIPELLAAERWADAASQ